ncbi:MAG: hypothetical protein JXR48_04210 [Candidatus Delongbacteria bacterium]|nr:hypothetical protein [Candidatus Delongbacteria bacterium]MBN2834150.1 hypothetical protein [Candidatus Delongbacteria bacterium]
MEGIKIEKIKEMIQNASSKIVSLKDELNESKLENSSMAEKITVLENKEIEYKNNIIQLEGRIQDLEQQLSSTIEQNRSAVYQIESDLADLEKLFSTPKVEFGTLEETKNVATDSLFPKNDDEMSLDDLNSKLSDISMLMGNDN